MATTQVQFSQNGFFSAFMKDSDGHVDLLFPRYPDDDTSASRESFAKFEFQAPGEPGRYSIVTIWTRNELLRAEDIEWDDLEEDACLHVFADFLHTGKITQDDWAAVTSFLTVQPQLLLLQALDCSNPSRILALRTLDPEIKDPEGVNYWSPLLFDELRDGYARFAWDGGLADLNVLKSKPEDQLTKEDLVVLEKAGFMWDLEVDDLLVYINLPRTDQCTIVRVVGGYWFTKVWDPESRGYYRHMVPCEYIGTFERNPPVVSQDLSSRLKIRRATWSLENVRSEILRLVEMFEHSALI